MCLSTFQPGRTITQWPADVLALADHLDVRRFAILGTSGGGPYVLACCAALPQDRLAAAGAIAALYPTSLGLKGMLMEPRVLLLVAPWATWLVVRGLDWSLGAAARNESDPAQLLNSGLVGRPGRTGTHWRWTRVDSAAC